MIFHPKKAYGPPYDFWSKKPYAPPYDFLIQKSYGPPYDFLIQKSYGPPYNFLIQKSYGPLMILSKCHMVPLWFFIQNVIWSTFWKVTDYGWIQH